MTGPAKPVRIAIVGNCQAVGLAAAATHMLPGAEVKTWHVGVNPKISDQELLALLPGFDLIISQISDWDEHVPLRISLLRAQGLPVFYLPGLVFAGFHPDLTYIRGPNGFIHGVEADYHSIIVAAAYALGLPDWRVPELFNALVFAELGYFEVFEASKAALFENFAQEGIDLKPHFDVWLREAAQFMYTLNHPHILVLATLCRIALAHAGHVDLAVPLPDGIDNALAAHFVWPTYPVLARRIGVPGSTTFLRRSLGLTPGQSRDLSLADYVAACYRIYDGFPTDLIAAGAVKTACERLKALVVA
jgi:hypothetical protein